MLPAALYPQLAEGAREAVWNAYCAAHRKTRRLPHELQHIYSLIDTGLKTLQPAWKAAMAPFRISLRVTGVFIHQTPSAQYFHPRDGLVSPELGDLLIVHEHAGLTPFRRAVITQVKRCTSGQASGLRDERQEYLYQNWPDFLLKGRDAKGRPYLPGPRSLRPGRSGSRYGLVADDIDPHGRCGLCSTGNSYLFPWMMSDPADPACFAGGEDLGAFIANMLYPSNWQRGRDASSIPAPLELGTAGFPNDHFAVTVEELLQLTAARTMAYKRYRNIRGRRGRSVTCFQLVAPNGPPLPDIGGLFSPTDIPDLPDPDVWPEDLRDGGISTLLIETSYFD